MIPKNRAARIALEVVLWALALLLISVFVRAGLAKFDPDSGWSRAFAHWGYPVWFRVTIGVLEIGGDSLVSKARDMRDVLLASSASEFFTRHQGPHEIVAQRVQ